MRRLLVAVCLLGLIAARPATGQRAYFYAAGDTVLSILTGDSGAVELWLSSASGVSAYDITVFFDDGRVGFVGADSLPGYGLPSPTATVGTGQVQLVASGTGYTSSAGLATIYFAMDSLAAEGTLLSVRVNALTAGDGVTDLLPSVRTDLWDVCQAERMWGDLDGNRKVNSRDALIAVTAAVGLPVGGFAVEMGDVDRDGITTTRDALFLLSHGVGINTYTEAGNPRPNRCAPLTPSPADLAFWTTSGLTYIAGADTVEQVVPFSGGLTSYYPSWSPDGTRLAVVKYIGTPYYYDDIVTTTLDGSQQDTLFVSTSGDYAPSWSPDGTKIAFVSTRSAPYSVWVMNADGTNQVRVSDSVYVEYLSRIAWSPDGSTLAFTGYHVNVCCTDVVWTVNAGAAVPTVPDSVTSVYAYDPTFSPAGDSIGYDHTNVSRVFVIGAAADTGLVGGAASALYGAQDFPVWMSTGLAFRSDRDFPYDFYLRRFADGRHLRLTRDAANAEHMNARRTGVYVDTVTVTPQTASIFVGDTTTIAATVKNSDGSTNAAAVITWRTRNAAIATVDSVSGFVTGTGAGVVYIVGTAGGWRSDSTQVTVSLLAAPPAPGRER